MKEKILCQDEVLDELMNAIETGRAARPHFVHSRAQVEELQIALITEYKAFWKNKLGERDDKVLGPHLEGYIRKCIAQGVTDFTDPRRIDLDFRDTRRNDLIDRSNRD